MRFSVQTTLLAVLLIPALHSQPAAPAPTAADTLFQSGIAQLSQGKYQDAEASFRKLAEIEPTTSRGVLGIADVWLAQKKGDEAFRMLQDESAKNPTHGELHYGIANMALRTGKYDLALAEFQFVLDHIDRNSKDAAELYLRMGEAYRLKGDLEFAIKILQQAQAIQPSNVVILNSLAFTLESTGQRQLAADQYRKILELDPKSGIALNNLAFLLADTDTDATLALAYALRARQLFPNEPTIIDTLGWVYVKLNRADDALPLFRELVQKSPGRTAFRYHLAVALEMKGEHAEAKRESDTALKSNPSKEDEEKINQLLKKIPQ